MEMVTSAAIKCGFKTAIVVDYPDSKRARKIYLVVCAGDGDLSNIEPLRGGVDEDVDEEEKIGDANEDSDDEKVEMISKK